MTEPTIPTELLQELERMAALNTLGHFLCDTELPDGISEMDIFKKDANELPLHELKFAEEYEHFNWLSSREEIQEEMRVHYNGELEAYKEVALKTLKYVSQ